MRSLPSRILLCIGLSILPLAEPARAQEQGMIESDQPVVQPEVISGSFVLPGSRTRMRLHHTAGEQFGGYPSYTSLGATRLIRTAGGAWMIDGQLRLDNHSRLGGSFDTVLRWNLNDTVWGLGLGADLTPTAANVHVQGVLSLEMLRRQWGLRANAYAPFDSQTSIESEFFTSYGLQGTTIQRLDTQQITGETAMSGIDFEAFRNLGDSGAEVYLGGYAFESDHDEATGAAVGIRGNVTDNIAANARLTHDSKFDTQLSLGLTWFFGGGQQTFRAADRRLTSLVQRNHFVSIDSQASQNVVTESMTDQASGDDLHLFFVSESGTGAGTQDDPASVAAALANPNFAAGSVLVLLDDGGPLTSAIALTADRQQVLGAQGGSLTVDLTSTIGASNAFLRLRDLGGGAILEPGAGTEAIRLSATGNGHVIAGFTLDGSGGVTDGITDFDGAPLAVGATDTLISNMLIRDFAGTGILIQPSFNTTIENTLFENNGQDIALNAANTTLRNLLSTNSLGDSISLSNATGTTTIDGVTIMDSAGSALTLANASGQVDFTDVDIADAGGAGIDLQGGTAVVQIDSDSSIVGTVGAALDVQGGSSDITFDGVIHQTSSGAAIAVDGGHDGSLMVEEGSVSAASGSGLSFQNADGTYQFDRTVSLAGGASVFADSLTGDVTFEDLFIDSSTGTGILLNNQSGSFTITDDLDIVGASGSAAIEVTNAQSGASADFGEATVTATGAGTVGIDLSNNDANSTLSFADLNVATGDAIGIRANQGGRVEFLGTAARVSSNGGAAVDLEATAGRLAGVDGWVFSELSSTNSSGPGIRLTNLTDSFQVIGGTSISNATGIGFEVFSSSGDITLTSLSVDGATTGLDVTDHTGTLLISGVDLMNGSGGQIQNVNLAARLENVANATLRNMNLHGATRGVESYVTNGNDSLVSVQNSTVVGDDDAGIHLDTSAAGSGELNVSLWNNDITARDVAVSLSANGGDIGLSASENEFASASSSGVSVDESNGASVSQTMDNNTVSDQSIGWVRDSNPSLIAGALGADGKRETVIADPDVLYDSDSGTWHLYYFAARATTYGDDSDLELYIQHATSADGSGWSLDIGQALTLATDSNAWDSIAVETPSVVIDPLAPADRRFKLYYSGASEYFNGGATPVAGDFPKYQLGLAFSSDGNSFTRLSAAESPYGEDGALLRVDDVLGHLPDFDKGVLADPEVKLIDGTYNLWFSSFATDSASNTLGFGISHATSADGINFTPSAGGLVPSLLWPQSGVGGQQPSVAYNSALERWEAYFTSDTAAELALMPSTSNPSLGIWRSTSPDHTNWTHNYAGRDFSWDPDALHEQVGLMTGLEVVIVDDVRHVFYTGWSSVDPPPGFVVPSQDGFDPAVLTLLHATRNAYED